MDFDPRDYDSRDDERFNDHGRDDGASQPDIQSRDGDDEAREAGRGPGRDSRGSQSDEHGRGRSEAWSGPRSSAARCCEATNRAPHRCVTSRMSVTARRAAGAGVAARPVTAGSMSTQSVT